MKLCHDIAEAIAYSRNFLSNTGQTTQVSSWQGVKAPAPMFEALDCSFKCPMPRDVESLTQLTECNAHWAEEHFQERVGGIPLNPPPSSDRWPYKQKDHSEFKRNQKFSHTYPERFWPKNVENPSSQVAIKGIRYDYGDFDDLINLLKRDPYTRQAWLPIWFPEDTGSIEGQRVPCTIGYFFIMRSGYLHLHYVIRSCDFLRHFKDDIYMAIRLAQYVLLELQQEDPLWQEVELGYFSMSIFNLHVFDNEKGLLIKK